MRHLHPKPDQRVPSRCSYAGNGFCHRAVAKQLRTRAARRQPVLGRGNEAAGRVSPGLAVISLRVITFGVENQISPLLPNSLESKNIRARQPLKISPHLVRDPKTVAWEESDCPSHRFARGRAEARIWNSGPYSFYDSRGSGGKQLRAQTLDQAGLGP